MAFTVSLLLQKWHFLSSKRRRSLKKYFFVLGKWGTLAQKKGHFFHFKNSEGAHASIAPPPPVPRPLESNQTNYNILELIIRGVIIFKTRARVLYQI